MNDVGKSFFEQLIAEAETKEELREVAEKLAEKLACEVGCPWYAYVIRPEGGDAYEYITNFPEKFVGKYIKNSYHNSDTVVSCAHRDHKLKSWDEAIGDEECRVREEIKKEGIVDGAVQSYTFARGERTGLISIGLSEGKMTPEIIRNLRPYSSLFDSIIQRLDDLREDKDKDLPSYTPRELDILRCHLEDLPAKVGADKCDLKVSTYRTYTRDLVRDKSRGKSIRQMSIEAYKRGLI